MLKKITCAMLAAAMLLLTSACATTIEPDVKTGFYFDTFIEIKLYGCDNADEVFDGLFSLCKSYDTMFSDRSEGGELWDLNHANGEAVELSNETLELIERGIEFAELSDGAFDISCGAVTTLWDFSGENNVPPDAQALSEALRHVGYENIVIDGNKVSLKNGVQLDLGGIAKGYIADRLKAELLDMGVQSATLNLGGNVLTVGNKLGKPFRVGIQSPFDESGYAGVIEADDLSVVTAGSYERQFEYEGVLYHHILDLRSGMPADTGLCSVTILSEKAVDGDALSTICFLLGAEKGLALVESLADTEAVFISESGETILSSGARLA